MWLDFEAIFQQKDRVLWTEQGWSAKYHPVPDVVTLTDVDSSAVEQMDKLQRRAARARAGATVGDTIEPHGDLHAEGAPDGRTYDTDEET